MIITEIFKGIEGEGVRVGIPQLFIRLQGCRVGCKACDTKNTWSLTSNQALQLSPREVYANHIVPSGLLNISITGGDPLLQRVELLELLGFLPVSYYINIEATGLEDDPEVFTQCDFISADIKTPSSGVYASLDVTQALYKRYEKKLQLKAVVADEGDLNFLKDFHMFPVVITPCWEPGKQLDLPFLQNIQDFLWKHSNFRMIVQQHKFLNMR